MDMAPDQLEQIYGPDYFHGEEYADYVAEGASLKANFRDRLRTLLAHVPDAAQKSLFEIGCAYGFFLGEARHRFRSVAGIDIADDAIRHARDVIGVDAVRGDYASVVLDGKRDVFCLWDTIEHLNHPDHYIAKISKEITPGGIIAITTGDIDSLNARLRGARWRLIHPPTHLHYFSRATLTGLLKRHGFSVVHVEHPGNSRTLGAILYGILVLRAKKPALYRIFERFALLKLKITINLFDIMYVIARRDP